MVHITAKTLYDTDFALWVEDTVSKLKTGDFHQVDWENLIEEVESLGKRDKRELKNRLITLFEHILKRKYVPLSDCYRGWEVTIKRTQSKLRDILADSPSLRHLLLEIYRDCYDEALENMRIEYDANFPDVYPFINDVDVLLNQRFWEDN
ncbi:DUF29 domain-containing protein [Chrysosporum bergii ANA360D]|jgi:hypothetical protein|uniref:DUF29 domain-containing protein n=1 Tax=Chrysosporum bergii ANA360D TaxID=617107 RepID=A0AA43GRG9_9CYAN|nr:DUF29 domain-containing protein [Chrysosporum bergii]MDH6059703.1 DUF29 domain-containing protein [Chrysosporum bergii ANA360D]